MGKDKHTAQIGGNIGRIGVFLYAREYCKYKSFQFGVSVDLVKGYDRYLDIELKILCFGIGVRFIIINNYDYKK